MTLPNEIMDSELFEFVKYKSIKRQIKFEYLLEDLIDKKGTTEYSHFDKWLKITIDKGSSHYLPIHYHELLHAKLNLLGYPQITYYSRYNLHPTVSLILENLQNSVHHIYVYKEMKKLGINQSDIDNEYFSTIGDTIRSIKVKEGQIDGATPFNLLEAHLRDPIRTKEIVNSLDISYEKQISLFDSMINLINRVKPSNPHKMRNLICKMLNEIQSYLGYANNELNNFIMVHPGFEERLLSKKAINVVYGENIHGYPHVFIKDKLNKQCIFTISNNGNFESDLRPILEENTLKTLIG